MADNIQDQLSATGYAQVVAITGPETTAPGPTATPPAIASAAHREAAASVSAVAADVERHFIVGSRGQVRVYPYLGAMLGTVDQAGLRALRDDERVHEVHGAPLVSAVCPIRVATARKPAEVTWGLERLGIPALWAEGLTGEGVLVGHLDTGIDIAHPALESAIATFAEFDFLGNHVAGAKPHDTHVHGTHTAGTIAGREVGETAFGVAPGAMLVSAIVIDGGDTVARLLGGMNWAIANGARILNISVGIRGHTDAFLALTRALRARDVLPVSAVGNEGPGTSRSPGNYAEVLSVGACDEHDEVAEASASMRCDRDADPLVPDLVAPGISILSCIPDGEYAEMHGTSQAAPHIAGLAALLMQASPTATADQVEQAIFNSCVRPPGMLPERGNRGIPSGPRALALLREAV